MKKLICIFTCISILLTSLMLVGPINAQAKSLVLAINNGGEEYEEFEPDQIKDDSNTYGYVGDLEKYQIATSGGVTGYEDFYMPGIFTSELVAHGDLEYVIELTSGNYLVEIYIAETWFLDEALLLFEHEKKGQP